MRNGKACTQVADQVTMDRHRPQSAARFWPCNVAVFATVLFLMIASSCRMSGTEPALYFPPPGEGLEQQDVRRPEEVGLDPGVIEGLRGTAARWALWRHGYLVHVEGEFNKSVHVASLRKTCHALTVGAAIQQGKIPSWDQKISVWETELKGFHADATWWHVMTQSSGFDYPYGDYPAFRPGEIWTYSDKNPLHLTNALAKVYGKAGYEDRYEEVLKQAYFDAIGMRGWAVRPRYDGAVLSLDLEDMGRIGLLVLARGRWGNEQIIPQDFVDALETKQTRGMKVNYNGPDDGIIELDLPEAPYGFMTWVNTDRDVFRKAGSAWAWGYGAGGHAVYWNRELGLVLAVQGRASGVKPPELLERWVRAPNPLAE
jgi:CubicO group peptidase (beta-lactamase class C family)